MDARTDEWEVISEQVDEVEEYVLVNFESWEHFSRLEAFPQGKVNVVSTTSETSIDDKTKQPRVSIVGDSLLSSTPQMVFGDQLFEGEWTMDSHCAHKKATNLGVVILERNDDVVATDVEDANGPAQKPVATSRKRGRKPRTGAQEADTVVAGLLEHLPGGVDQDTALKRLRTEREKEASKWSVKSVIAPSAVIKMTRVR